MIAEASMGAFLAERRALLAATPRIVGAPDRVAVFRNDEERQLAVIEAAQIVRDLDGKPGDEEMWGRALDGLYAALDALTGGTVADSPEFEDMTSPDDGNSEVCAICGRGYMLWHAPQPLWDELIGHYAGTRCPRCFDKLASEKGIWLTWTPIVSRRDGIATTNWWGDPIRDRLLVGEPDPHFHDDERAQVPQGHWGEIAKALGWPYETPYPDENRSDRMEGVIYHDSGVNAEAAAYKGQQPAGGES